MRRLLKIIAWIIGSVLLLVICAALWLQTQSGKNFLRLRVLAFLRHKLKTRVEIGVVEYKIPTRLQLQRVLFLDQRQDTLLSAGNLEVSIQMLKLISGQVAIGRIALSDVSAHIYRNRPDTTFNFSYIAAAFAGKPKPEAKELKKANDTSTMQLDISRLDLDRIHIRFDDYTGGSRLDLALDALQARLRTINPATMDFALRSLDLSGLRVAYLQDQSFLPEKPKDTSASPFKLVADRLRIDHSAVRFEDRVSGMQADIALGDLQIGNTRFDLMGERVDIGTFRFDSSSVNLLMAKAQTAKVADTVAQAVAPDPNSWRVTLGQGVINQLGFILNDPNAPAKPGELDYGHLDVRNLALRLDDLRYGPDTISARLGHLALQEHSGLTVEELKAVILYHPQGAELRDLYVKTPNTLLHDYLSVRYPSLEAIKKSTDLMQVKTNLVNSYIGLRDVLLFVPALKKQPFFRTHANDRIAAELILEGYIPDLRVQHFYAAGLGNTLIDLKGNLKGLPDPNRLSYSFAIRSVRSSRRDLEAFLPPKMLQQVRLPDVFRIEGTLSGTTLDYRPNLNIVTSDGNAQVAGYVLTSPGKNRERYSLALSTRNLNLGRILRRDTLLGVITARFSTSGTSFDIKSMVADIKGKVEYAYVKGYGYRDINLDAKLNHQSGTAHLNSADPNARLQLDAQANLGGSKPSILADLNIDSIDLQALKLYEKEFRAHMKMHADIPVADADYPQGNIYIYQPLLVTDGKRYLLDSLKVIAHSTVDSGQNISADLQFLQASLTGHIPLTKVGAVAQEHIARHYTLSDSLMGTRLTTASDTTLGGKLPNGYDVAFHARAVNTPLLQAFVPDLKSMDTVKIDATIDPRSLTLNLSAPKVEYGAQTITGTSAAVNGTDSALTYKVAVDELKTPQLSLLNTSLEGDVQPRKLTSKLLAQDEDKKDRFRASLVLEQQGPDNVLSLDKDLLINYKEWTVTQPNKVVFGKEGFYVQNLNLSSSSGSIAVNSNPAQYNAPLTATIDRFIIGDLTQIISKKDTLLANGILSGNVTLRALKPAPLVDANLQVQNLSMLGDTIGNVTLTANSKDANDIGLNLALSGQGNDLKADGDYYMTPVGGNQFDIRLLISRLNLASLEGATMYQIRNSSGNLTGDLRLTGTPAKPGINGSLKTEQLKTTVKALGSSYLMPSETITINDNVIGFPNFTVVDSAGSKLVVSGTVNAQDLSRMLLDLNVNARNFKVINSTAADNKEFYGKVFLTSNLQISGPAASPSVEGSLNIEKGTRFSVAIPERQTTIQEHDGIVEFIDTRDTGINGILPVRADSADAPMKFAAGSNININIGIDPEAEFNVLIDQATGDFLKVRGAASLNANVSPGGDLALTGNYELKEGAYQLNYNFIKRLFKIQPGSTINFSGDPLQAEMNITAIYTADVAPYDLVEKQVPDPNQLNYYRQRLPFQVQLKLNGALLKPAISFNIDLPENGSYRLYSEGVDLVQAKLSQLRTDTSELNKQVFALLILNRFVGENPFSSSDQGGASSAARQSVSRFISEQLNQYASSLVKGIDLSLDLVSTDDYTTGTRRDRTDLNVNVSKRLLNDRLTLSVGNDFTLEGPQGQSTENTSVIPGNLAADYRLSPDGRYTVRAYRKTQDEGVLEGRVIESGLNFIVSLDYNKFKNLFNRKQRLKQKEEMKKQREEMDKKNPQPDPKDETDTQAANQTAP